MTEHNITSGIRRAHELPEEPRMTSDTLGGFIHILLVLAIVAVLIRIIQGRTPVA